MIELHAATKPQLSRLLCKTSSYFDALTPKIGDLHISYFEKDKIKIDSDFNSFSIKTNYYLPLASTTQVYCCLYHCLGHLSERMDLKIMFCCQTWQVKL